MLYGIISDIHANLAALKAVLAHMGTVDALWCLGDLVGYGPDPDECVEMVREIAQVCIAGNHDWACIGKLDTAEFNPDAERACLWTRRQLTAQSREYLAQLPETWQDEQFTLAHGSPSNPIWEYVLSTGVARRCFGAFKTRLCLVGHTHVPVIFQQQGQVRALSPSTTHPFALNRDRLIINPGSVGQPRDGNPEASYAVVDTDSNTVEHRRVTYPITETQRRMEKAGLPLKLIVRLDYGW